MFRPCKVELSSIKNKLRAPLIYATRFEVVRFVKTWAIVRDFDRANRVVQP
jgi:hypothetical protein